MKRFFALMLVFVMLFSLAACGKTEEPQQTEAPVQTEAPEELAPSGETSMGNVLMSDFISLVAEGVTEPQQLADSLLTNSVIQFAGASAAVEEGFLAGFNQEISGFEEGVMFAPVIGSIAFVGYVFRAADADAAAALVQTLSESADLRWNICVEADEMVIEQQGELVFFVMCPGEAEA